MTGRARRRERSARQARRTRSARPFAQTSRRQPFRPPRSRPAAWRSLADRRALEAAVLEERTRRCAVSTRKPTVIHSALSFGGWMPMTKINTIDEDGKHGEELRTPRAHVPRSHLLPFRRAPGEEAERDREREGEEQEDHRAGDDDRVGRAFRRSRSSDAPQTNSTARVAPVQIAATGVRYFGLTFDRAPSRGRPPSRAKAKIMREAEVTVARPQRNCATKIAK